MAPKPEKKVCGAKNRQGNPCQKPPLIGAKRCKLHGGKVRTSTDNTAFKHGIYTEAYSPEELAMIDQLNEQLGTVDAEINMVRIRLRRAQLAEAKFLADPELELVEVKHSTGDTAGTTTTERAPDWHGIIDRLTGRLGTLMKLRSELIAADGERGGDPNDAAARIRAALKAMVDVETKQPPLILDRGEDIQDGDA